MVSPKYEYEASNPTQLRDTDDGGGTDTIGGVLGAPVLVLHTGLSCEVLLVITRSPSVCVVSFMSPS